ncbi:MAG: hypothetical protein EOP51_30885, partial [Sphingobacteriales bacterium]
MKNIYLKLLLGVLLLGVKVLGQTNPTAYNLATGSWTLTGWNSAIAAGSYPLNGNTGTQTTGATIATSAASANMVFWLHGPNDPLIATASTANYTSNYINASGKIFGNGTNGIGFNNTGGVGIGSAVLSLNTTGRSNIQINWTGRTLGVGARTYGIRLMYRIGTSGLFLDANPTPSNIFYAAGASLGSTAMPTITLPSAANNTSIVQVLWYSYNEATTTSGTRPTLGLDEISVSSSSSSTNFYWNGSTTSGPPTGGPSVGGSGAWNTTPANTNWISPTDNTSGTYTAWTNSTSSIANFTAGSGTSLVDIGTNVVASNINISSGLSFAFNATTDRSISGKIAAAGNLSLRGQSAGLTIADEISGAGTLSFASTGTGAVTLNGNSIHTGPKNLISGILNLGHANALGTSGSFNISGGTLDNSTAGAITIPGYT